VLMKIDHLTLSRTLANSFRLSLLLMGAVREAYPFRDPLVKSVTACWEDHWNIKSELSEQFFSEITHAEFESFKEAYDVMVWSSNFKLEVGIPRVRPNRGRGKLRFSPEEIAAARCSLGKIGKVLHGAMEVVSAYGTHHPAYIALQSAQAHRRTAMTHLERYVRTA